MWSIIVSVHIYMYIQVLAITAGNISIANQSVVSKVQQVSYWIPYTHALCTHILHSFMLLHSASPQAKPQTRACNIWCIMHSMQYSILDGFIHKPEAFKDGKKTEASVYRAHRYSPS